VHEVVEDRPPWRVAEDADPLSQLLVRQDGVISRQQALRLMTAKSLRQRVASGRWRSVRWGILVAHNGPISDMQRLWIGVLAVGGDAPAYLGGLSALIASGLRGISSNAIHVLVPASRRISAPPGVALHRTRHLPKSDRRPHTSPPATALGRSVVDAAQWARSDDEARLIIASSFQQRLVDCW
jgi:hypothetical protein